MPQALLFVAAVTVFNAVMVVLTGGFSVRVAGVLVREHQTTIPIVVAALAVALAVSRGRASLASASTWWWTFIERFGAVLAAALALATVGIGMIAGTHVAGGSDSYCYLNQAEIFARGNVRELQPLATQVSWPEPAAAFIPAGHAVAEPTGAIVPMCPPGYPLMMAAARIIGGRSAMFWVVPLMGGLAVYLAFVLGTMAGGPPTGVLTALSLSASPVFIYQVVQPMNDVPAAALWLAALVLAWRAGRSPQAIGPSLIAGVVCGFAVLVRPNLVPLVVVVAFGTIAMTEDASDHDRRIIGIRASLTRLTSFGAGVLPSVLAVMALQNAMYGGPLTSAYGSFGELFKLTNVLPNLKRYPVWLLQTETPTVALSLAAPLVVRSREVARAAWWLLTFAAASLACYLPYAVFDAWWYLRFLLPAVGPLLALTSAVVMRAIAGLGQPWRLPAFALVCAALSILLVSGAVRGLAFDLRRFEARFREAGEYVGSALPSNTVVLTSHQSGSVRFYSGHSTVLWGSIDPAWLDRALDDLRGRGFHPYLLFEVWEEQAFRTRFAGQSRLAGLDWPPAAEINRQVRIYDPSDYELFVRGASIHTDRVWTERQTPNRRNR